MHGEVAHSSHKGSRPAKSQVDVLNMPPPTQPSIRETAFSCPHCSVFTTQFWYEVLVDRLRDKEPLPYLPGEQERKSLERDEIPKEHKQPMLECMDKIQTGLIFLGSEKNRCVGS